MAKNKPASKKVVLLLVEGFSDRNALKKIMQRIYKNRLLVFEVTQGDITSDKSSDESEWKKYYCKLTGSFIMFHCF